MTPAKYFYKRLRGEIAFQYNAIRTVADWTVLIYILIPSIAALIIWQINMWHSKQTWLEDIPLLLFMILIGFLLSIGSLRLYIQKADMLFLRQQKRWFRAIVYRGMAFSFIRDLLLALFWFTIASPFLIRHYEWSWTAVAGISFLGIFTRVNILYAKNLFTKNKWTNKFVQFIFFVCFVAVSVIFHNHIYIVITFDILFTVIFLYMLKSRLQKRGSFATDIVQEEKARWRITSLLLSQVIEQKKDTGSSRKQPYIFPKSGRIFRSSEKPHHRLSEIYIKLLIRDSNRINLYVMLIVLMGVFIIIVPSWIKWGVWIAILPLIADYLRDHILETSSHTFLKLWPWPAKTKQEANKLTIRLLLFPASIIYGSIAGGLTFSYIGVIAGALFGFFITYPIARLVSPA